MEREAQVTVFGARIIPHVERLEKSAERSAHYWNLDGETTQALLNFTILNYRIKSIATDFKGQVTQKQWYQLEPHVPLAEGLRNEDPNDHSHVVEVTRENYEDYLRVFSSIAFNLYNFYFRNSRQAREAAGEVQRAVGDLFPEYPLSVFHDDSVEDKLKTNNL
jgi:hypothetical protein